MQVKVWSVSQDGKKGEAQVFECDENERRKMQDWIAEVVAKALVNGHREVLVKVTEN